MVQRAQVSVVVVVVGRGFGIESGVGDADAAAEFELVGIDGAVVFVSARVWFKGSLEGVRVSAGFASDGFVREREGGWRGGRGFREEGRFGLGGGGFFAVVVVVETRLVMRRGRGTRLHAGVVVVVEVLVGGWTDGAERLWEIECRTHIGWLRRKVM